MLREFGRFRGISVCNGNRQMNGNGCSKTERPIVAVLQREIDTEYKVSQTEERLTAASQQDDATSGLHRPEARRISASARKMSQSIALEATDDKPRMSLHDPSTWVQHPAFETTFCLLILCNTLIMAVEVQYNGIDKGEEIGYPKFVMQGKDAWPGAVTFFIVAEVFFGSLFTLEILIKIVGLKWQFVSDAWNWFDLCIVLSWLVDTILSGVLPIDTMLLRLARLARLMRLIRLVRTIQAFDALYILTTSLKGSLGVLFWSFILIFTVQMMIAFALNSVIMSYVTDETIDEQVRFKLFAYFGSCSRAMLTMFEISLANWPPVARMLMEDVSEYFVFFSIAHKLFIGFAVIGVVNGVFMQETFKVAASDDQIMMRQTERRRLTHLRKMTDLFEIADSSGDGLLDLPEFCEILKNPKVKTWLAAQELSVNLIDGPTLFQLITKGGKDQLSAEDLVNGVARLKGNARSMDLTTLMHEQKQFNQSFKRKLDDLSEAVADVRYTSSQGHSWLAAKTRQWQVERAHGDERDGQLSPGLALSSRRDGVI
eukprot:TRINITY_DN39166_c0_g1_i2.p1 TRINITY_DN39166_c0_g1~~TRINITY_DN39166_c0_g1_i2.p1  ORF type:complete len:635 (+),score=100.12 TRINITY_DN39166_c0_g1_i2:280-1905(+)